MKSRSDAMKNPVIVAGILFSANDYGILRSASLHSE